MHLLDEDTRLTRLDEDRFLAELSPRWWGYTAAHGGYLAALLLRAMTERVADPARAPRSLTVHFLRGPEQGPAEVHTEILRSGGKLSSLTAKLVQNGSPTTFAVAAFGAAFEGEAFQHAAMPAAPDPASVPRLLPSKVEIDHRFEHRQCFGGAPFGGASTPVIGGFSRFVPPRALDALSLTVLCDAWWPALFTTLSDKKQAGACPTVDLTIHFRTSFPIASVAEDDFVLVHIETAALNEGYLDERCDIWSQDGRLLAQTVQHAARLPPRR